MTGDKQQGNGPASAPPQAQMLAQQATPSQRADAYTPRARWLTVSDAMEYLDAVKVEYRNQPKIYDEFLAIMGRFKSMQMLPPDVIVEVARLFRGRNSLVLRFNRFLPDGYKIGLADIERMEQEYSAKEDAAARTSRAGTSGRIGGRLCRRESLHGMGPDGDRGPFSGDDGDVFDDDGDTEHDDMDIEEPGRTHEFDHAIHYVTTIKRRFSSEPGTYKAFLDILHTYQREQRGINQVLEQVTELFSEQPDLLREFTYFLPDNVQAQAKERLDQAALDAEIRLGFRSPNGQLLPRAWRGDDGARGQGRGRQAPFIRDHEGRRIPHRLRHPFSEYDQGWRRDQRGHGRFRGRTHRGSQSYGSGARPQYANGSVQEKRGLRQMPHHPYPASNVQRGPRFARKGRQGWSQGEDEELGPDGTFKGPKKRARAPDKVPGGWSSADTEGGVIKPSHEHQLFDRVRQALSAGGDSNDWTEFLKCLDLFNNQILERQEMLNMMQDMFETHHEYEIMDEFKDLVHRRGELDIPHRDAMAILGLSEINFQSAKKCTPSYRELPEEYQLASCNGRSADEDVVLNDTWVSVPVGSEDSNNFKHMRRNPHEETLFKTEDERFELDMLIDSVAATIARLEPVEEEIEALRATADAASFGQLRSPTSRDADKSAGGDAGMPHLQYRLDRRTLGAVHLSTISRLYGEHGAEVLELMRKNPARAIPVVLKRLREKEKQWVVAREEAKAAWKESAEDNFHRSLDHRSHHFRREDKRFTSNRALLQEIKDKKVEEDPHKAAVVKAAREKVKNAQDDHMLRGRASPTSTAAEGDSASAGQGSAEEAEIALDAGSAEARARASPESSVDAAGEKGLPAGRGTRSKEGIRLLREQAEATPPWYMFSHLTLVYPGESSEEVASIHKDVMDLICHTLARRPPAEEDVRQATTLVADLFPSFFALNTFKRPTGEVESAASTAADASATADSSSSPGENVLSMPVISSDDDSDNENSQSSSDERQVEAAGAKAGNGQPQAQQAAAAPAELQKGTATVQAANQSRTAASLRLENQQVFFTTTDFYLVLRAHHIIAERLTEAKRLCRDARFSRQTVVAAPHKALRAIAEVEAVDAATDAKETSAATTAAAARAHERAYRTFLGHLYDILEDKINSDRYDECVRHLVGNKGYVLCSLDKLVVNLLQNLHRASADKVFKKLTELYHYERATQPRGVSPALYRNHTHQLLRRSNKEVVRVQYHGGTLASTGGWTVRPTLKMEYVGQERGQGDSGEADGPTSRADSTAATEA